MEHRRRSGGSDGTSVSFETGRGGRPAGAVVLGRLLSPEWWRYTGHTTSHSRKATPLWQSRRLVRVVVATTSLCPGSDHPAPKHPVPRALVQPTIAGGTHAP